METFIHILKLSAGVGLFLFAMYLIEESLKNLSGRNFKLFLQRSTKTKLGAVTGGAVVTAVLQSSSLVSLMVLAFVGAGVFTMKNALAIILGANLGTTLASWLVASFGFTTNIDVVAYPAIFMGGLLLIIFGKRNSVKYISYFLFGFGLVFVSLAFMKTAMEDQVQNFDFSVYMKMPLVVFSLIGFLITLLVQSSSVTMALALTALHVGAINFPCAAALVLGSETGTTIKLLLSGIGGTASKKRVVLGNFLFNIVLTILAFIFIRPLLELITSVLHITNPLIGLVTFSTLVNLFGIILFLPFLNFFVQFLEKFFKTTDVGSAAFIIHASVDEPQTAVDLFKRETNYFIYNSMLLNMEQLEIDTRWLKGSLDAVKINQHKKFYSKTTEEKYEFLKLLQGELQSFYLLLRTRLTGVELVELTQLVAAILDSMHSVKSLKDIKSNIANLSRSSKNVKFNLLTKQKSQTENLYKLLNTLMVNADAVNFESLQKEYHNIQTNHSETLANFYIEVQSSPVENMDMTTVINFNRELFSSNKAMIMAVKGFLVDEKHAESLSEITVGRQ